MGYEISEYHEYIDYPDAPIELPAINLADEITLPSLRDGGVDATLTKREVFFKAASSGRLKVVKRLVAQGVNPRTEISIAMRAAAQNGRLETVRFLLPLTNPKAACSQALNLAAENGHLKIVKLLLPASDLQADEFSALRYAASNGHLDIVKLLLPVSDPKADGSRPLRYAAKNGHLGIVKLLLPLSDPKARGFWALRHAASNGHLEIVEFLLPHSDYAKALVFLGFISSPGCDILLSCLPQPFVKQFVADNPSLSLPRASALLASQHLRRRNTGSGLPPRQRLRS